MTRDGNKTSGITKDHVREQLADETDPKAIKRLTAAREYLEGLSPEAIEEKYSWHHQTIYNWLNRFEERGLRGALARFDSPAAAERYQRSPTEERALFYRRCPQRGYRRLPSVRHEPAR